MERQVDLLASRCRGLLDDVPGVDQARFPRHFRGDDLQRRHAGVGIALEPGTGDDDHFGFLIGDFVGFIGFLRQRERRHEDGDGGDLGWKDGFAAEYQPPLSERQNEQGQCISHLCTPSGYDAGIVHQST